MLHGVVRAVNVMGWIALAAALVVNLPGPWWDFLSYNIYSLVLELMGIAVLGFPCSLILLWCTTELTPRAWQGRMEVASRECRLDALLGCLAWFGALLGAMLTPGIASA